MHAHIHTVILPIRPLKHFGKRNFSSLCCSPVQVAINWTICKGAVPIPGAKNARQAKEAAGGLFTSSLTAKP